MKKINRKSKKKLMIFLIFMISCCLLYNYLESNNKKIEKKNIDSIITKTSESDTYNLQEIFANGMNIKSFNEILTKKSEYLKETGSYKNIKYNFENSLSYNDIENIIYELNNSNIVKVEKIGYSVDSRKIYSVEIGKGNKKVLIDANIHAAETANTIMILKYMIDLVNKYELKDKNVIDLLNDVTIVIIPCINPDGYEVYNFGIESINNKKLWIYKNKDIIDFDLFKFNANGIDINRNLPTQNAGLYYETKDLIYSASKELTANNGIYFGGKELGSEPETRALIYTMLKHYKNTKFYINLHSQGRVIYHGKPNLSDEFNELCNTFANYVSQYNNYTPLGTSYEEVGEGNDGSATDFMAELVNGFAFSEETGRLTNGTSYINAKIRLKYECPVVNIETLDNYTKDVEYYKEEYYNTHFYDMLVDLIKKYIKK